MVWFLGSLAIGLVLIVVLVMAGFESVDALQGRSRCVGITGRTLTVALRMTELICRRLTRKELICRRLTRKELICRRLGRNRWAKKPGIVWLMRG